MSTVTLMAVGYILVNREDPDTALAGIRPLLDAADVAFGNFEGVLTDSYPVTPGGWPPALTGIRNSRGLTGLDVVSLATNHTMDAGSPGLADTVKTLTSLGIRPTGAGMTLADALRPALVEREGLRVAFVAATAVLQHGAEARVQTPGVAPLRADDCYLSPYPGGCAPGLAPRVLSVLNEADWEAVAGAVGQAREMADLVVVIVHWGDHTQPYVLTDHERLCAELLAEAGASLVLGHHHNMPRGVEVIAGTPVFFGVYLDYLLHQGGVEGEARGGSLPGEARPGAARGYGDAHLAGGGQYAPDVLLGAHEGDGSRRHPASVVEADVVRMVLVVPGGHHVVL